MNGCPPSTTWEWLSQKQNGIKLWVAAVVFAKYIFTVNIINVFWFI